MTIAFVQLGSLGDCLNSTLMFKPIKAAYPGHRLIVHTSTYYQSAYSNNPYVDELVTHPAGSKSACFDLYNTIPKIVRAEGHHKVLVPAPILYPDRRNSLKHPEFGQNLICTFMRVMEEEGIEYDWPVQTVLHLTTQEIDNVNNWLRSNRVDMARRNVLMEVHHESGQSFWNHAWTEQVAQHLMKYSTTNLFISSRKLTREIATLEQRYPGRVRWAGTLSVRECAELFNRCGYFFSISSGLSNACNTDHCRTDSVWIETVNSDTVSSAPVRSEGKIFWYEDDVGKFMEMLWDINI